MILSAQETQIVSQVLKRVFNADIAPDQIKNLQVHDETVVVVTPHALYSLGKNYFRQLVETFKAKASRPAEKKPVRQAQEVECLQQDGINSIWQVIGETGNLYLVSLNARTNAIRCGCKAGSFGRSCYHVTAVKEATGYRTPAERGISSLRLERKSDAEIREENKQALKRGAIAQADGTVAVNNRFYQLMGSISQVRGAAMRELNRKRRNALLA